jgi:cell fate regulator YaaT (PSP1 superfamily)
MEAAFSPELELSQEKDTHKQEIREKEIETILAQMGLSDLRIQADRAEIVDLWSAFGNRLKVDTRKMIANLTSLIK